MDDGGGRGKAEEGGGGLDLDLGPRWMSERVAGNPRQEECAPTGFHTHLSMPPLGLERAKLVGPTTEMDWNPDTRPPSGTVWTPTRGAHPTAPDADRGDRGLEADLDLGPPPAQDPEPPPTPEQDEQAPETPHEGGEEAAQTRSPEPPSLPRRPRNHQSNAAEKRAPAGDARRTGKGRATGGPCRPAQT
jgi:hypothetical protein